MRISDWSSDVCSSDLLPLEILEFDAQALVLAQLFLAIAANVTFTLQHVENANAQLGCRAGHAVLARLLAVADTGEHITQRIGQCHLSNPYQLDLVTPGIRPLLAKSRSCKRERDRKSVV